MHSTCDVCGELFYVARDLTTHRRRVHDLRYPKRRKAFGCEKCGKKFRTLYDLGTHVEFVHQHGAEEPYLSSGGEDEEECVQPSSAPRPKSRFPRVDVRREDVVPDPVTRRLPCDCCDLDFATFEDLLAHIPRHLDYRLSDCVDCDLRMDTMVQYWDHVRRFHVPTWAEDKFTSPKTEQEALKTFYGGEIPPGLEETKREGAAAPSSNGLPTPPPTPRKSAPKKRKARLTMRSARQRRRDRDARKGNNNNNNNNDELSAPATAAAPAPLTSSKPLFYMCPGCSKCFASEKRLESHRRLHPDGACDARLRRFPCTVCAAEFKRKDSLDNHVFNVHLLRDGGGGGVGVGVKMAQASAGGGGGGSLGSSSASSSSSSSSSASGCSSSSYSYSSTAAASALGGMKVQQSDGGVECTPCGLTFADTGAAFMHFLEAHSVQA